MTKLVKVRLRVSGTLNLDGIEKRYEKGDVVEMNEDHVYYTHPSGEKRIRNEYALDLSLPADRPRAMLARKEELKMRYGRQRRPIDPQDQHARKKESSQSNKQTIMLGIIKDATEQLDHANDDHWNIDDTPNVPYLSSQIGANLTKNQVEAANPGLRRAKEHSELESE